MIEAPCQTRKHYAPFRCEYVPEDVILSFCQRVPKLCRFVLWDLFKEHLADFDHQMKTRGHCLYANRKGYRRHPLRRQLETMIQREMRYEKSTFASGHIIDRFGRVYRRAHGWDYHKRFNEQIFGGVNY